MTGEALLYWGLGLLALSVLLVFMEVLIPSGGIIAVGSAVAAIVGCVLLFRVSMTWGLTGVLAVMVLGPTAFFGAMQVFPSTPFGRALIGGESDEDRMERELREREETDLRRALVEAEGIALCDLHPIGEVEIDGNRYDALAEHDWIDGGSRIVVSDASGFELRVLIQMSLY
ncbi:MAG: hypothetical protein AAF235_05615 [Planctomycetota bacterium]